MKQFSKIIESLNHFLYHVSKEEKDKIWAEVEAMNITGPTVYEYFTFSRTMSSYNLLRFQNKVKIYGGLEPPPKEYKLTIEAPKFSLESFFFVI